MKYLYIEKIPNGYRIMIDVPNTCSREGTRYYGYTKTNAIKQFRRDFNCVGKHFEKIEF